MSEITLPPVGHQVYKDTRHPFVNQVTASGLCTQRQAFIIHCIAQSLPPRNEAEAMNFGQWVDQKITNIGRIPTPPPEPNTLGWKWKYHWSVGEWRQHSTTFPCEERRFDY